MNADLEKLVKLHHVDTELTRLEAEKSEIPKLRKALEERVARERGRLDAARAAAEASTKARKQHESAVQELESKRSKYKGQLMDVKTNKEYTAMLHEIENVEREIHAREDLVLEEMEKAEGLARAVRDEEADFKVVDQAAKAERTELEAREARLAKEAEQRHAERDAVLASIPDELRERYQRVARLRGTGVAEARDGVCQTCHMKMRLQVWVELRSTETILQCDSCSRILFYEPPAPTVVVEP